MMPVDRSPIGARGQNLIIVNGYKGNKTSYLEVGLCFHRRSSRIYDRGYSSPICGVVETMHSPTSTAIGACPTGGVRIFNVYFLGTSEAKKKKRTRLKLAVSLNWIISLSKKVRTCKQHPDRHLTPERLVGFRLSRPIRPTTVLATASILLGKAAA